MKVFKRAHRSHPKMFKLDFFYQIKKMHWTYTFLLFLKLETQIKCQLYLFLFLVK